MLNSSGQSLVITLAALLLVACAAPAPLTDEQVRAVYQPGQGSLPVTTVGRVTMEFAALNKQLQMRMAFPSTGGPYPLIMFSHGNGCSQDQYAGFADHWASKGYVVIQPVHMDSIDLGFSMKGVTMEIMTAVVSNRPKDVQFIVDNLAALENSVPDLKGKIDRDHLIAAGHSMGAGTAMVLTGVPMTNPINDYTLSSDEDRFELLILISEPSNNRIMPEQPWRNARVPLLVVTGTEDFSTTGAPDGKKSKNAWFVPEGTEEPDVPHYYLKMDGSDHYYGGVICRADRPGPRDTGALEIANGVTTAFMDAYIKDDQAAMQFLTSGDITPLTEGRAKLDLR